MTRSTLHAHCSCPWLPPILRSFFLLFQPSSHSSVLPPFSRCRDCEGCEAQTAVALTVMFLRTHTSLPDSLSLSSSDEAWLMVDKSRGWQSGSCYQRLKWREQTHTRLSSKALTFRSPQEIIIGLCNYFSIITNNHGLTEATRNEFVKLDSKKHATCYPTANQLVLKFPCNLIVFVKSGTTAWRDANGNNISLVVEWIVGKHWPETIASVG